MTFNACYARTKKVNRSRRLLSLKLRIVPEPSLWRVRAKPEESPRLFIYDTHMELLRHRIAFSHLTDVNLKPEGAVTFRADGKTYCYVVLNATGEEVSIADTRLLFALLAGVRNGGIATSTQAFAELAETRRTDKRLQMIAMTVILVIFLVVLLTMMFK